MSDDLLRAGIKALRAGHKREARRLFGDLVREQPDNAVAWWYLSAVLDDPEQKAHCLRQVLHLLPDHVEARQMLAEVDRQVARPTPPGGLERPIMEALESREGLIALPPVEEESPPVPPPTTSETYIMLTAGLVALLAIIGTVVLIMTGTISGLLGIEGPSPTASPPPHYFRCAHLHCYRGQPDNSYIRQQHRLYYRALTRPGRARGVSAQAGTWCTRGS